MEERIERLESKLMFAEDLLDELNRTVYRQQQQIDLMQQHLRQLAQQMQAVQPPGRLSPEDEVPPHY
ncbi:MAG: SlyX protein [Betaproteobacteria bacterium HGW-Betaproteobacteria-13]|jgi:SlyX protein|uniref:SlyX protein n=1 Tax=Parazoarcus communis TaxID=41977 RepID=A0A2U8H6S4_9RHOO|nr:SlyX family protein [Parazoarcus communis]MCK9261365.1 SlyX family protein [Azoarcus sp.]PKO57369.1 MAG: SlyX protein [Betaproteobacteria bacterium HGW-Betaproteobacteria-19]PKO82294.1 MAG: SlyX protein [Betaproteobacteria bacterium HGW-Betaproteobacteria-13]TVT58738.1 MAG: SlyX family protein [Azoarcus sp. PHD]AWI74995.1 SlyX protein [Parazoarcus communis]|tara:strand:- start:168805 stop:169005 length:201 start_codon:yes stop_codon:yes gene_type:complete